MKKILILICLLSITSKSEGQKSNPKMVEIKNQLVPEAVEIGKNYGLTLNFTDKSIKSVEIILDDIHKEYKKSKNDEGLTGLAYIFGFYIIETIERNHGKGRMEQDDPEIGKNSFPFYWNNSTLFPIAWCQKRIFDGEADDVSFKYQVAVLQKKK